MRKSYDFSRSVKNPYAKRLKRPMGLKGDYRHAAQVGTGVCGLMRMPFFFTMASR